MSQSIFKRSYHYSRALYRWVKARRPLRSEAEIKWIFETHCKPCEAYDTKGSLCSHCGCRVNLMKTAPLNKIAMATEECPLDKWSSNNQ